MATAVRPPATYTTIARALKSVRALAWTTAQLTMLNMLIDMLADDLWDLNPRFDVERFKTMAGYAIGDITPDIHGRNQT